MKAARQAVADLTGTTANAVILAPSIDVLYQRLDTALRPVLRRGQLLASRADTHQLTNDDIAYAEPDLGTGEVPAWQYTNLVTGDTRLVTLSAVHPQVGTVNDVSQISENVREHSRAWVLVDATALAGFSPITIDDLGVDMVIVDCTAIGAPQVAALAFRDTSMFPRIDMAAFLEDVAPGLVAGLPAAVDHLEDAVHAADVGAVDGLGLSLHHPLDSVGSRIDDDRRVAQGVLDVEGEGPLAERIGAAAAPLDTGAGKCVPPLP